MGSYMDAQLWGESVSTVTNTNSVRLGEKRIENGDEYMYLYNDGTQTLLAGTFVRLVTNASGYSINNLSTAKLAMPFAVVRNTQVCTAQYFWGLKRGFTGLRGSAVTLPPCEQSAAGTSGLFAIFDPTATALTDVVPLTPFVHIIVSIETIASNLTGWGYVNF